MRDSSDIKWYVWLILSLVTICIIALGIYYITLFPSDKQLESIAGITGSIGTILTVLWFSASLLYQGKQIKEQRLQFYENLNQSRSDLKLNALEKANDILNDGMDKIEKYSKGKYTYQTIFDAYSENIQLFKALLISDPDEIIKKIQEWMQYELLVNMYLDTILASFRLYSEINGLLFNFDCSKEDFILINQKEIFKIPYFSHHQSYAVLISTVMSNLSANRASMILSFQVSFEMKYPGSFKNNNLIEQIQESKKTNVYYSKIMEVYEQGHPTKAST